MMYVEWSRSEKQMKVIDDRGTWYADVSCVVRNDLNGWRPNPDKPPADEVVYAITKENTLTGVPVMPRQFPIGKWTITGIERRTDEYREPYLIMTDAFQPLDVWTLNDGGGYDKPTGEQIIDYKYGLHFSRSNTTQGCIKVTELDELLRLVQSIWREFDHNRLPTIEVVA